MHIVSGGGKGWGRKDLGKRTREQGGRVGSGRVSARGGCIQAETRWKEWFVCRPYRSSKGKGPEAGRSSMCYRPKRRQGDLSTVEGHCEIEHITCEGSWMFFWVSFHVILIKEITLSGFDLRIFSIVLHSVGIGSSRTGAEPTLQGEVIQCSWREKVGKQRGDERWAAWLLWHRQGGTHRATLVPPGPDTTHPTRASFGSLSRLTAPWGTISVWDHWLLLRACDLSGLAVDGEVSNRLYSLTQTGPLRKPLIDRSSILQIHPSTSSPVGRASSWEMPCDIKSQELQTPTCGGQSMLVPFVCLLCPPASNRPVAPGIFAVCSFGEARPRQRSTQKCQATYALLGLSKIQITKLKSPGQ